MEAVVKLDKKLEKIIPALSEGENPRQKISLLAKNLYLLEDPSLRNEAEGLIRKVGMKSPDIFSVVRFVKKFSQDYIRFLKHEIKQDGSPYGIIQENH